MVAGAGSLGALLSIAVSVRARTVAIDGELKKVLGLTPRCAS